MNSIPFDEMVQIEGGKPTPEFIIMCGILTSALGTLTLGLGFLAGVACIALGNG